MANKPEFWPGLKLSISWATLTVWISAFRLGQQASRCQWPFWWHTETVAPCLRGLDPFLGRLLHRLDVHAASLRGVLVPRLGHHVGDVELLAVFAGDVFARRLVVRVIVLGVLGVLREVGSLELPGAVLLRTALSWFAHGAVQNYRRLLKLQ